MKIQNCWLKEEMSLVLNCVLHGTKKVKTFKLLDNKHFTPSIFFQLGCSF